MYFKLEIKKK